MNTHVKVAAHAIQVNESIELSPASRFTLQALYKAGERTSEKEKIRYYNELRIWAERHENELLRTLLNRLESGGTIRWKN